MHPRHWIVVLCTVSFTGLFCGCAGKQPPRDAPWDIQWQTLDIDAMADRDLLGVYNLTDPGSGQQYQVILRFNNKLLGGVFNTIAPYRLTAFYTTDGDTWTTRVLAEGTRCIGFSERAKTDSFVVLHMQPYYVAYTEPGHPLREKVHQPRPVTLTIRDGLPELNWQGPPTWDVKTRSAPYNQQGTVFTGTVKSAQAWGFASYTEELPMTYYYLELEQPVAFDKNLSAQDRAEQDQRELHLIPATDDLFKQARGSVGKRVTVVGSSFHSHTAYHRRPVVVSVDMILEAQPEP